MAALLKNDKAQPILNPKYELEQAALLQEGLSKKLVAELNTFGKAEDTGKTGADPNAKVYIESLLFIFQPKAFG